MGSNDMSEMVERVARVLCWKNGMNPDLTLGGDGQNYLWHEYEDAACAAIAAMREAKYEAQKASAMPDDVAEMVRWIRSTLDWSPQAQAAADMLEHLAKTGRPNPDDHSS